MTVNEPIDITEAKDGGILKEIIREGAGDVPQPGDTVIVHYVGTLADGSKFDSSRDRDEKFTFQVGRGSVIKGWDQGIPTMKRGELAKLTIRGDYGYGEPGSPPKIPGNATLVFEIELFDFHGEDLSEPKDQSILRRVLQKGQGYATPNDGAQVVVSLLGRDKSGRVFDERNDVAFEIGDGANHNIIEGIEFALTKFKKEERSVLDIKARRAWGAAGNKEFGIAENTDVSYEVELKSFEKAPDSWQLNGQEKLEQSEKLKNRGAEFFKVGKYDLAARRYRKITDFLQNEVYDTEEEKATATKLLVAAHLNLAACSLKTKEFREVIEHCTKALERDAKNEKGLFRMAQAYFGLAEYSDALGYFNQVLEVNPSNRDAINHVAMSKQKIKEYHEKEKALYTKMFSAVGK